PQGPPGPPASDRGRGAGRAALGEPAGARHLLRRFIPVVDPPADRRLLRGRGRRGTERPSLVLRVPRRRPLSGRAPGGSLPDRNPGEIPGPTARPGRASAVHPHLLPPRPAPRPVPR